MLGKTSNPCLWRQGSTKRHLDVGLAVLSWRPTTREQQPNGTMVTQSSPHVDSSPLAIANRHYDTNNQLVQNTRYRLILAKASNLDWLTRDRHAMRDLSAVAREGSNHWVLIQDLPFDEIILFAYAADHSSRPTYVCLPSGLYHARNGRILQQSGPNQEVTPLPGIYFFDGWRVRPCLKIPTNLPRAQDPPEHDTQPSSTTAHTAEQPQTPDEEARDILAKAIRNHSSVLHEFIPKAPSMEYASFVQQNDGNIGRCCKHGAGISR